MAYESYHARIVRCRHNALAQVCSIDLCGAVRPMHCRRRIDRRVAVLKIANEHEGITALTSVPSEARLKMPITGKPSTQLHVARSHPHSNSRIQRKQGRRTLGLKRTCCATPTVLIGQHNSPQYAVKRSHSHMCLHAWVRVR